MFKEMRVSGFLSKTSGFCFIVVLGLLYSTFSLAACSWKGSGIFSSVAATKLELNSSSYRMIAHRNWYDDRNFPPGTLMAVDSLTMAGFLCNGLPELHGQKVDVVYVPPPGATPSGAGYLVTGNAAGVAMKVEFLDGTPHRDGIYLGTSAGAVSGSILTTRGGLPSISIRLTLVKTGKFAPLVGTNATVWFPNGLGWFRYYSASDPLLVAAAGNQLVMDDVLAPTHHSGYVGLAMTPSCSLSYLGDISPITNSVVHLKSVSSSDFLGVGPINLSSRALPLKFSCEASISTRAFVTFDANFPLNAGVNGVAMPDPDSDIGVQILLNEAPVRFGSRSSELPWAKVRFDDALFPVYDVFEGFLTRQGKYCVNDCGDTVSGPNWVDGAVQGFNLGMEPVITFRYYQTSNSRPVPRRFTVPFTISLDWD